MQLVEVDETCSFWIVLSPNLAEVVDVVLLNWRVLQAGLGQERVDDDRDEEIKEDL